MSKNFELLQRVAKEEYFNGPDDTVPAPQKAPAVVPIKKEPAAPEIAKLVPVRKEPPDPEIAKLVQRLFSQAGKDSGPKVVSFSGITRDDRSSWICARAGEILAEQADTSVCVVEANLKSPQLHVHFATTNRFGLTDALTSKEPIRNFGTRVGADNLWL